MLVHADPIVTLSAASYTAFENETSVEICAALTLLASVFPNGLPSPITVELSTTDSTAGTCSYMYITYTLQSELFLPYDSVGLSVPVFSVLSSNLHY